MPDVSIPRRSKTTLGHIDGDLEVEDGAIVSAESGTVTVEGSVVTEGDVVFDEEYLHHGFLMDAAG